LWWDCRKHTNTHKTPESAQSQDCQHRIYRKHESTITALSQPLGPWGYKALKYTFICAVRYGRHYCSSLIQAACSIKAHFSVFYKYLMFTYALPSLCLRISKLCC